MERETYIYIGAAVVYPLLTAVLVLMVFAISRATRGRRERLIEAQRSYVEAWEDADDIYPGIYAADLERERTKLAQLQR